MDKESYIGFIIVMITVVLMYILLMVWYGKKSF